MPSIGSFGVAKRLVEEQQDESVIVEPTTFEFFGADFRIIDGDPSAFPLMELADAAANGLDSSSMQGLAAMYRMLRGCINPEDWPRFRETAMANGADPEDILDIVKAVWEYATGRPTQRPSDSPGGPQTTSISSRAASPSPGTAPPSAVPQPLPADWDPSLGTPPSGLEPRGVPLPGWPVPPPGRTDLHAPQVLVDEAV